MSYSSGGLIQATDYNALVGSNSTTAGTLNYVWDTGNGAFGYGQGAISAAASAGTTVPATQWSTMLNALNRCLQHQSGVGATLGPVNYTAGGTITYFANVNTAITSTIQSNKALYTAQGSTTTGSNFDDAVSTAAALTAQAYGTRTVTFASADAARYFFNAGGQLNYVVSTPTAAGTGRNADFVGLIGGLGGWGQRNVDATGRTGTGQTLNTNSTTFGYRNNVFNTWTSVVAITSTAASYNTDTAAIQVQTTSSDTTNGANGLNVQFRCLYTIADHAFDDQITVTHRVRVDIVYPETTYLSSSPWGTPTVS